MTGDSVICPGTRRRWWARGELRCCGSGHGEVAEWQTRTVQVRVPERAWGFNSPLPHHHKGSAGSGALAAYRGVPDVTLCSDGSPAPYGGVACDCRVGD